MTRSQIKALIATLVAVCAAVLERLDVLPALAGYREWLTLAVVVGGLVVAALNQSLNTNHVSVPLEVAEELVRAGASAGIRMPASVVKAALRDTSSAGAPENPR